MSSHLHYHRLIIITCIRYSSYSYLFPPAFHLVLLSFTNSLYNRQPWDEFVRTYNKRKNQHNHVLTYCKDPLSEAFRARLQALRTAPRGSRAGLQFHLFRKYCDRSTNEVSTWREERRILLLFYFLPLCFSRLEANNNTIEERG